MLTITHTEAREFAVTKATSGFYYRHTTDQGNVIRFILMTDGNNYILGRRHPKKQNNEWFDLVNLSEVNDFYEYLTHNKAKETVIFNYSSIAYDEWLGLYLGGHKDEELEREVK